MTSRIQPCAPFSGEDAEVALDDEPPADDPDMQEEEVEEKKKSSKVRQYHSNTMVTGC